MIVLDASAWVEVLAAGGKGVQGAEIPCVPPHFDVEVVSSIRSLSQRGVLTEAQSGQALERHLRYVVERLFDPADVRAAWELREAMSFRDAWYVALAQRLGATWVTADARAARVAERYVAVTLTD